MEQAMSENSDIILYQTPDGKATIQLHARDGSVWLNQTEIAQLFGTSKQSVSRHILKVFADKELREISVVNNYLTTAADGKQYEVAYYSLEMILAIGFRVRSVHTHFNALARLNGQHTVPRRITWLATTDTITPE